MKLRDKHGVTGNNPQENKRNKRRKMAVKDEEAPKIELLPSAFTAMVSPEMMASIGFTLEGLQEHAEDDEEQQITGVYMQITSTLHYHSLCYTQRFNND
jgi:hypothetical protein